jgi:hypothetical protein
LGLVAVLWLSVSIAPTHGVLAPRAASADHVERETMLVKTVNALTPINVSGGKILMEGEIGTRSAIRRWKKDGPCKS